MAGVEFDVRGLVQVVTRSREGGAYPLKVPDITLGRRCRRLHFLHAAVNAFGVRDGTKLGHYTVHYADNLERDIPLIVGRDLADWWNQPDEEAKPLEIAWTGTNAASQARNRTIRLFKTTWDNPSPDTEITAIDLSGDHPLAAPFLVAITAEP